MARSAKAGGKKSAGRTRKARSVRGRGRKAQAQKSPAAKPTNAVPNPPQIIAELRGELDKARAGLAARDSAYSDRMAYQAATNEVLKVMSGSPGDPQPVFDLISVRARDLCNAYGVTVYEFDGSLLHWRAATGVSEDPAVREAAKKLYPSPPSRHLLPNRAIMDRATVHVRSYDADTELHRISFTVKSGVVVPMMRGGLPIGALHMRSRKRGGFSEAQVELLQTFADQAVIAIEIARLFNETKEALARQTATSDILRVISGSVADAQPVFAKILDSCKHLFGSDETAVLLLDGEDTITLGAYVGKQHDAVAASFPAPLEKSPAGRAIREQRVVHYTDVANDSQLTRTVRQVAQLAGYESMAYAPLVSNERGIGAIGVSRSGATFSDKELMLLQTFADQAVIAIENARLFNEVQAKTRDLEESLQQQTATSEVLQVINSSPSELAPVFDAMLARAMRLCEAAFGGLWLIKDEGYVAVALRGMPPAYASYLETTTATPGPHTAPYRFLHGERSAIQNEDLAAEQPYLAGDPQRRALVDLGRARTALQVPLVHKDKVLGVITIYRQEVKPFTEKQVTLLQNFAEQAVVAIENARLFNETKEALERQTATSDILKVIASSPSDVQPVFDAIAERSNKLMDGHSTGVYRFINEIVELVSFTPVSPEADAVLQAAFPRPLAQYPIFDLVRNGNTEQLQDVEAVEVEAMAGASLAMVRDVARARGFRSVLLTPLPGEKGPIGLISVTRKEPSTFAPHHVQLLQTFADQAVIAIENARLFDEVQARTHEVEESLQQQTATSEVLQIISSSPGELGPVFDKMLENATRVCGAEFGSMTLVEGDTQRQAALYNAPPAFAAVRQNKVLQIHPRSSIAEAIRTGRVVQVKDMHNFAAYLEGNPASVQLVELGGARTLVVVPMLRDDEVIGAITVFRQEVRPFGEKQIDLLRNFARQAVIAIENARLLRELRQRTDDLSESLQQQTATSEVLQIISSSPGDLAPVFNKMLENATRVCGAEFGSMNLVEGDTQRQAALYNAPPALAEARINKAFRIHPQSAMAITIRSKQPIHIADIRTTVAYLEGAQATVELVELGGARTIISVPMLRDGEVIGVITVFRQEVRPFDNKQIELLTNFARQAVIAIENARLLRELRQRTDDLAEALTYQTGSSNILRVIASSPTDVKPVLQAIVGSACELCEAADAVVVLKEDNSLVFAAHHGPIPVLLNKRAISRGSATGRAVVDRVPVHIHDALSDENNEFPEARELSVTQGIRSVLSVPLMREEESIGAILLRRTEVQPFSEKQVELLKSFADQAVIAISNVRLFEEVQARTRDLTESLQQQTATSEVLQVISASQGELDPVFQTMLEKATRVCGASFGTMNLWDGEKYNIVAVHNIPPAFAEYRERAPIIPHPGSPLAMVLETHLAIQVPDLKESPRYKAGVPNVVGLADVAGARTILVVPMLKDDDLLGAITIIRQEVKPFTDKQVALVENFTKQAVIAIENARLLNALKNRTDELSRSLDDLRTAQDRLIQTEKLASLGQLTAGIAHEIKNPLNFINNFSALSVELTEELNDLLKQAALAEQLRKEIDELTGLLKSNLEKVVQHGKRADSIVKNMLLHSREGSGELRAADINGLVEESLNLAYHGARAEKSGFNITVQRDFDAGTGSAELFPQEITRALLNLISNGFYAATKRKAENGEEAFEPTLSASTKNLGTSVEIRIRDNGMGIPAEVKEKIFNPFFTTKPAGEGTGLGLSMTHDIIVKQHGGTIRVDTEPGEYTEFIVTLPRASGAQNNQRSTG